MEYGNKIDGSEYFNKIPETDIILVGKKSSGKSRIHYRNCESFNTVFMTMYGLSSKFTHYHYKKYEEDKIKERSTAPWCKRCKNKTK